MITFICSSWLSLILYSEDVFAWIPNNLSYTSAYASLFLNARGNQCVFLITI